MLNAAQVHEAKQRLIAGHRDWNGIPLAEISGPIEFAQGEIAHGATEPSEELRIPPPFVVGGNAGWMQAQIAGGVLTVPTKRVRHFTDCQPIGWRSLKLKEGIYWSDAGQHGFDLARLLRSNDDGYVAVEDKLYYLDSRYSRLTVGGTGLFVPHLEPGNHGSFIFRALPKLLYAMINGLRFDYILTPHRYEQFDTAMALMGREPVPQYTCRELVGAHLTNVVAIDDFDAEGAFDAKSAGRLSDLARRALSQSRTKFPRRIFVSRELQRGFRQAYRPLLNESDLIAGLGSLGFTPAQPEALSFAHQMACFATAECIVGPSGSGMMNSAFAPSGTKVLDMEFFAYTVRQHAKVYATTGKQFGFAFGEAVSTEGPELFRAWRIDQSVVISTLAELGVW